MDICYPPISWAVHLTALASAAHCKQGTSVHLNKKFCAWYKLYKPQRKAKWAWDHKPFSSRARGERHILSDLPLPFQQEKWKRRQFVAQFPPFPPLACGPVLAQGPLGKYTWLCRCFPCPTQKHSENFQPHKAGQHSPSSTPDTQHKITEKCRLHTLSKNSIFIGNILPIQNRNRDTGFHEVVLALESNQWAAFHEEDGAVLDCLN